MKAWSQGDPGIATWNPHSEERGGRSLVPWASWAPGLSPLVPLWHSVCPPTPRPGPWTPVGWGVSSRAPCVPALSPRPPPAPAVPPAARGDGAHRDHPHPGARGAHQGAGEPQPLFPGLLPWPSAVSSVSAFLLLPVLRPNLCLLRREYNINLLLKCAVLWYEIYSRCCASITIIHSQNFSSSPNETLSPQILAPIPLPPPAPGTHHFLFLGI